MLSITTISTEREWDALEPHWNALVDRTAAPCVFQTWEWLRTWWRWYAEYVGTEGLCILVASDGGAVVGIAPLHRVSLSGFGLGRIRGLRWVGAGSEDSDYLDFIIEQGREVEVVGAFFDHLAAGEWDVMDLDLVRTDSASLVAARESGRSRGYRLHTDDLACTALRLPGTWDDYLGTLRPRFRTRLRSLLRRLPVEHDARFEQCEDPAHLDADLETMFDLHQQRWRMAGAPGSFALAQRRSFYHAIAATFLDRGWLRFYRLSVAGQPAAYEFSFEFHGRVYYLQQAHDPAFAHLSVGTALKAFVLRDCIERGVRIYDFLGDDAEHKLTWGAELGSCLRMHVARPGIRVAWALGAPRVANRARALARSAAPAAAVRLKRRLGSRLAPDNGMPAGAGQNRPTP
jgi:CelD/BcsL family acetyltransferase involved in cellulose biosynthesis